MSGTVSLLLPVCHHVVDRDSFFKLLEISWLVCVQRPLFWFLDWKLAVMTPVFWDSPHFLQVNDSILKSDMAISCLSHYNLSVIKCYTANTVEKKKHICYMANSLQYKLHLTSAWLVAWFVISMIVIVVI